MATGDSGCEAYTAIAWGVGLSHERSDSAGAEGFHSLEGNMCGTVMRGADALPGSKATSRAKGSHRNLGGLGSGRQMLRERDGPHREGEEPTAAAKYRFCFCSAKAKVAEYSSSRNCRSYRKPCKELSSRASGIDCASVGSSQWRFLIAKVGNPTHGLRISKTARKRGGGVACPCRHTLA